MNTSFCTSCGSKYQYSFAAPKFCSNCGESIGSVASKSKATASIRRSRFEDEDEDGIDGGVDYVPDIENISLDIESDPIYTQSLGSILQATQDQPERFRKRTLDLGSLHNNRGKR